jgi:hypothetical protein
MSPIHDVNNGNFRNRFAIVDFVTSCQANIGVSFGIEPADLLRRSLDRLNLCDFSSVPVSVLNGVHMGQFATPLIPSQR